MLEAFNVNFLNFFIKPRNRYGYNKRILKYEFYKRKGIINSYYFKSHSLLLKYRGGANRNSRL
jgi:hypothetical protein